LNGGKWPEEAAPPARAEFDAVLDRPEFDPTRQGHTFGGWYSNAALSAEYDFAAPVTGDVTLYAKWNVIYYDIIWERNGGTWAGAAPSASAAYDTVFARPSPDPSKTGHTFGGWYGDAGLTAAYNFSAPVTGDVTLYAKWNVIYYTISWALNGGTATTTFPVSAAYDTVLTQPNPNPSKTGHTFGGWYSNAGLTAEYDFAPVTGNVALYAKWNVIYYPITWELNGGTWAGAAPSASAAYGAVLPWPIPNPSKSGYVFRGWYANAELTARYNFSLPVTGDITLYARWTGENDARYLAFTADIHWIPQEVNSATYSNDVGHYAGWMTTLQTKVSHIDYMGYCGDNGNTSTYVSSSGDPANANTTYWGYVNDLMNTAETYVTSGFIGGNLFGLGNHEWYTGRSIGGGNYAVNPTGPAQDRLWPNHSVIDEGDYIIYALGPIGTAADYGCTQQFADSEINRLSAYLATAPSNVPIFIMAHHPIHSYTSGSTNRITKNGLALLTMLNDYPNVIFMWAHNHQHSDANYHKIFLADDQLQVADASGSASSYTTQPINFTYLSAGCMKEGDSTSVLTKGFVAKIEGGQVTLTYYNKDCEQYSEKIIPIQTSPTVTVTFDKNGGDTEANPRAVKVAPATTVGALLPAPPTRTDYTFTGWNTQANGSGAPFTANTTVTGRITVYAQWTFRSGIPYAVDLSGQTTRFVYHTSNNNSTYAGLANSKIKLNFPVGFNINDYSRVTVKYNFFQATGDNPAIATTNSCYVDAYFFAPWVEGAWGGPWSASGTANTATVTGTGPGMLQRLGGRNGTSDANSASNNNGFTFNISTLTTLPAGLQVNKHAGNSLGIIEVVEIRFHNDP